MSTNIKKNGSLPTIKAGRIGKSSTGEIYIELRIKGSVAVPRFFSLSDLNERGGAALTAWLTSEGMSLIGRSEKSKAEAQIGRISRRALQRRSGEQVLIVDRLGWNGPAFATRYEIHSPRGLDVARAFGLPGLDNFHLIGRKLKDYRAFARRYGRRNDLIKFLLCVGFIGPILPLVESELLWLVLYGKQGLGKSSLMNTVAAIYGGEVRGRIKLLESFSATENAAEVLSDKGRHLLAPFDDAQALPSDPKQRASTLCNVIVKTFQALEKARLNQSQRIWETVFMLGANERLEDTFARGRIPYGDYTAVRAIEVPAQNEFGIFDRVPKNIRADDFANAMVTDALAIRGLAGKHFVKRLVTLRHRDGQALKARLDRWRRRIKDKLAPGGKDSDANRVAGHFATIYAAGCLARQLKVLPWTRKQLMNVVCRIYNRFAQESTVAPPEIFLRTKIDALRERMPVVRKGRELASKTELLGAAGVEYRGPDGSSEYCFLPIQFKKLVGKAGRHRGILVKLIERGCVAGEGRAGGRRKATCKRPLLKGRRVQVIAIDKQKLDKALPGA